MRWLFIGVVLMCIACMHAHAQPDSNSQHLGGDRFLWTHNVDSMGVGNKMSWYYMWFALAKEMNRTWILPPLLNVHTDTSSLSHLDLDGIREAFTREDGTVDRRGLVKTMNDHFRTVFPSKIDRYFPVSSWFDMSRLQDYHSVEEYHTFFSRQDVLAKAAAAGTVLDALVVPGMYDGCIPDYSDACRSEPPVVPSLPPPFSAILPSATSDAGAHSTPLRSGKEYEGGKKFGRRVYQRRTVEGARGGGRRPQAVESAPAPDTASLTAAMVLRAGELVCLRDVMYLNASQPAGQGMQGFLPQNAAVQAAALAKSGGDRDLLKEHFSVYSAAQFTSLFPTSSPQPLPSTSHQQHPHILTRLKHAEVLGFDGFGLGGLLTSKILRGVENSMKSKQEEDDSLPRSVRQHFQLAPRLVQKARVFAQHAGLGQYLAVHWRRGDLDLRHPDWGLRKTPEWLASRVQEVLGDSCVCRDNVTHPIQGGYVAMDAHGNILDDEDQGQDAGGEDVVWNRQRDAPCYARASQCAGYQSIFLSTDVFALREIFKLQALVPLPIHVYREPFPQGLVCHTGDSQTTTAGQDEGKDGLAAMHTAEDTAWVTTPVRACEEWLTGDRAYDWSESAGPYLPNRWASTVPQEKRGDSVLLVNGKPFSLPSETDSVLPLGSTYTTRISREQFMQVQAPLATPLLNGVPATTQGDLNRAVRLRQEGEQEEDVQLMAMHAYTTADSTDLLVLPQYSINWVETTAMDVAICSVAHGFLPDNSSTFSTLIKNQRTVFGPGE